MARHGIAKKATWTGVVGGGGWEVAPPAHPLHWRNLRHPLAMSPRVRTHREGHRPSLRVLLEKEVFRGQWSLSVSRGGIRRCTLEHLCFSPTHIWVPSLMHLEGPLVNQPLALTWAARGTHPHFPIVIPDTLASFQAFLSPQLNHSLTHFFHKGHVHSLRARPQAGLRDGTVLLHLRKLTVRGKEVKTSSGLEATARGEGSHLIQPEAAGRAGRGAGRPSRGLTGDKQVFTSLG